MRNKITTAEAVAIGARLKAARLRSNRSLVEVGRAAGIHHSQVSRCERGAFKVISKNVRKVCETLDISHPQLTKARPRGLSLSERFDALIEELPGIAAAFDRLFDVLESSAKARAARKQLPQPPP